MSAKGDGCMKRWQEQRWILDAVIMTVGVNSEGSVLAWPEFMFEVAAVAAVP